MLLPVTAARCGFTERTLALNANYHTQSLQSLRLLVCGALVQLGAVIADTWHSLLLICLRK